VPECDTGRAEIPLGGAHEHPEISPMMAPARPRRPRGQVHL